MNSVIDHHPGRTRCGSQKLAQIHSSRPDPALSKYLRALAGKLNAPITTTTTRFHSAAAGALLSGALFPFLFAPVTTNNNNELPAYTALPY